MIARSRGEVAGSAPSLRAGGFIVNDRRHRSVSAANADTPPSKKLGLQQASSLTLIDAPADFGARLQPLPASLSVRRGRKPGTGLSIWLVRDRARLHSCMPAFAAALGSGALWIAWPKKTSGAASDLTQTRVREAGLAHGMVDYKISSVDETWSALLFRVRAASRLQ